MKYPNGKTMTGLEIKNVIDDAIALVKAQYDGNGVLLSIGLRNWLVRSRRKRTSRETAKKLLSLMAKELT